MARLCGAGFGEVGFGKVRWGEARRGKAWMSYSSVFRGAAEHGIARFGMALHGLLLEAKMSETRMIKIEKFVLSDEFYPRGHCDFRTVNTYAEAMKQGAEFPPVTAVSEGNGKYYLLDGWHRYRAWERLESEQVPAVVLDLPRSKWFAEALKLNITHGKPLTQTEKINAILRLRKDGMEKQSIGDLMQITVDYAEQLLASRVALHDDLDRSGITLKPALAEVKDQIEKRHFDVDALETIQRQLSGQKQYRMIGQLVNLLESDLLNDDDPRVAKGLDRLRELLCER